MNKIFTKSILLVGILLSASSYAMQADEVTFKSVDFQYTGPTIAQCKKMGYKMPSPKELKEEWSLTDLNYNNPLHQHNIEVAVIEPKWIDDKIRYALTGDDNPNYTNFRNKTIMAENCKSLADGNAEFAERKVERLPDYKDVVQFKMIFTSSIRNDGMNHEYYKLFDVGLDTEIKFSDIVLDVNRFKQVVLNVAKETISYENYTFYEDFNYYFENEWYLVDEFNIFFDKNGVSVVMPSRAGFIDPPEKLTIPYSKLRGILDQRYMPN